MENDKKNIFENKINKRNLWKKFVAAKKRQMAEMAMIKPVNPATQRDVPLGTMATARRRSKRWTIGLK